MILNISSFLIYIFDINFKFITLQITNNKLQTMAPVSIVCMESTDLNIGMSIHHMFVIQHLRRQYKASNQY